MRNEIETKQVERLQTAMRAQVERLQTAMRELPQLELVTNHYFADGMYVRELVQPEGVLVVGKCHKREHFLIITKGRLRVAGLPGPSQIVAAPAVIVSQPGVKRALLALEDSVYLTVHRTKKRDLEKIEKELIKPDRTALFDASNELKVKEIT